MTAKGVGRSSGIEIPPEAPAKVGVGRVDLKKSVATPTENKAAPEAKAPPRPDAKAYAHVTPRTRAVSPMWAGAVQEPQLKTNAGTFSPEEALKRIGENAPTQGILQESWDNRKA